MIDLYYEIAYKMGHLLDFNDIDALKKAGIYADMITRLTHLYYVINPKTRKKIHFKTLLYSSISEGLVIPYYEWLNLHKTSLVVPHVIDHIDLLISANLLPDETLNLPTIPKWIGALKPMQIPIVVNALDQLMRYGITQLVLPPGTGKTVISLYIATLLGLPALSLSTFGIIPDQWITSLTENTLNNWVCIGTSAEMKSARAKTNITELISQTDFVFCMDQRLKLMTNKEIERFPLLIVDEAHTMRTQKRIDVLLQAKPRYIIICSATPDPLFHKLYGPHRVETPVRTDVIVNIIKLPYLYECSDWNAYMNLSSLCPQKNQYCITLAKSLVEKGIKPLLITLLTKQSDILSEMAIASGLNASLFYKDMTTYKDADAIIGTTAKIGTAFDEKNFCKDFKGKNISAVIMCFSIKKPKLVLQNLGRSFRTPDTPYIFDLRDNDSLNISNRHAREREVCYHQWQWKIIMMN